VRLLLIEDNDHLAGLTSRLLTEQGFVVDVVATVAEAVAALRAASHELVILDLLLPDGHGRSILSNIRRAGTGVPVVVVTALEDVSLRITALNEGADDYLVKPFLFEELLARVRAVLRRPKEIAATVLTLGNLELDTEGMVATVRGERLKLSRRELEVLRGLMRRPGQLLAKSGLEELMYSFEQSVTQNAIEATISRLRRSLEESSVNVEITTIRGLGYILSVRT
jgi:two-component system, OmpR family, response regulator QseB